MLYEQIKILCNEKKITAQKMTEDLGLSQNIMTKWKNGTDIKSNTLIKIADYFGVTTDYLLGRKEKENTYIANQGDVQGNNTQNINTKDNDLSYLEMELMQEIKKLSKTEQIKLLAELNKE